MDNLSSLKEKGDYVEGISCWGRFKTKITWTTTSTSPSSSRERSLLGFSLTSRERTPKGGFKYDALSYAQNFDEGCWDEEDVRNSNRGFSSRYAVPWPKVGGDR